MRVLTNTISELSKVNEMGVFPSLLPNIFDHILDPLLNEVVVPKTVDSRDSMIIS